MIPVYAHVGDVYFTRSASLLGALIRWVETDPGEGQSWANHTGVVVESGWIGRVTPGPPAIVVEALWKTRRGPLAVNGVDVRVFAPVPPLDEAEVARVRDVAEFYVGDSYGWWKLAFHAADRVIFKGEKVLSRLLRLDSRPICSYLAARVFAAVGRGFGVAPQAADPDEMMDYCLEHPDEWRAR